MQKIYPFTNENITSFEEIYDFNNSKVLSVLGSGDQYFSSILYGAKELELFDINKLAYNYFILKFFGIKILTYDEFYNFFVKNDFDEKVLKKLITYLPSEIAFNIKNLYKKYNSLFHIFNNFNITEINYDDNRIIPYLSKTKYYQLQEKLQNIELPKFYLCDLRNLINIVSNNNYDIILLSNIYSWIFDDYSISSLKKFKNIIEKFDFIEMQTIYAHYLNLSTNEIYNLEQLGFNINFVESSNINKNYDDTIISIRKR